MRAVCVFVATLALCGGLAVAYPSTVYGVDVSEPVSGSQFSCLKNDNLTFVVARCWHSYGAPDTAAVGTLIAARSAGVQGDAYVFPCPKCSESCGDQLKAAVAALRKGSAPFNKIWLDIEGGSTYWGGVSDNVKCFEDMVNAGRSAGVSIGVYTSESQWQPIMGSYTGGSSFDLWYAHYDGQPSFSDFKPFNGWSKPAIKQFSDAGSKCGVSYDINWFPSGSNPTA